MATTTTSKNKTAARVDWSLMPHGPVSATALAAAGLASTAALGDAVDVSALWGAAGAGAGALGAVLAGAHRGIASGALLHRLACWTGAGAWLSYALATTPWQVNAWAGLAVGALTAGMTVPIARRSGQRPGRALVPAAAARAHTTETWEDRISRVCRARVRVSRLVEWESGAGYDVYVRLGGGGVTRAHIERQSEALAVDARLPNGCGITTGRGRDRGEIILHVNTVNVIGQEIWHPGLPAASVLDPIAWGQYADSSRAQAVLRELSMVVSGRRGSGKTTLLQCLTIALGLCRDSLVWHVDLNAGGVSKHWVDVWRAGRVQRCPIDWAAGTAGEAKRLLRAAIAVAKYRKGAFGDLKALHDADLLPVSADLPQITVIVDEGGQACKDTRLMGLVDDLQQIGRNEAVNLHVSCLRPTSDIVPVGLRKQAGVKVAMWGDEDDYHHLLGWQRRLSNDDLAGTGTGFASVDGAPIRPFRGWRTKPSIVKAAAIRVAEVRPDLDEGSAAAAGADYATRYERMEEFYANPQAAAEAADRADQESSAVLPFRPRPAAPITGSSASWAHPRDLAAGQDAPTTAVSSSAWPEPHEISGTTAPRPAAVDMGRVPDIIRAAIDAFRAAGDTRMHSEDLAAALGYSDVLELAAALREHGVRPRPKFSRNNIMRRGYWLSDLEETARALATGQTPPAIEAPDHTDQDDEDDDTAPGTAAEAG